MVDTSKGKYELDKRYASWKFGPIEWSRVGEPGDVYMYRLTWGRLRFHVFWRGDEDDPHDHPWGFTTFPIWPPFGYIEEYKALNPDLWPGTNPLYVMKRRHIPAWRCTSVEASHTHRVLFPGNELDHKGPKYQDPIYDKHRVPHFWPIITIVWRFPGKERNWGFWTNNLTRFVPWREYLYGKKK